MLPFYIVFRVFCLLDNQIMQGFGSYLGQIHILDICITQDINQLRYQNWLELSQLFPRGLMHGHVDNYPNSIENQLSQGVVEDDYHTFNKSLLSNKGVTHLGMPR